MEDDDYEYEYDTNATSTFLVEVDLATLNGIKRESAAQRAGRNKSRKRVGRPRKRAPNQEQSPDEDSEADEDVLDQTSSARRTHGKGASLQILDLNTKNPYVAHKGNFYSCAWHDVVGTDLFFAPPHQDMGMTTLRSNKHFQLLGTSRIRLMGSQARVFRKTQTRKKQRILDDQQPGENVTLSEDPGERSAATQVREQEEFLQKLARIREARKAANTEAPSAAMSTAS